MSDDPAHYNPGDYLQTCTDIVQPNECDKNGHLNVQFYVERFISATQQCTFEEKVKPQLALFPTDMLFRFHRELLAGNRTNIRSGVVTAEGSDRRLLHILSEDDGGKVCATALCRPGSASGRIPIVDGPVPDIAAPRNLPSKNYEPADTAALLGNQLALITKQGTVDVDHCGPLKALRTDLMVKAFHDAAMSLWKFVGFEDQWFSSGDYGGIAAEMKLTQFDEIGAGQSYEIVSWVPHMTKNVLHLANQLNEAASGKPVARICAPSMIFDRKTRRPVEFPEAVRNHYDRQFQAFCDLDQ
ncbi:MAG: hypothetical protein GKR97_10510 [Rhizobiaceae bacterium]|nr:hypothetical protein [Rhizobiaceae bacterium]